MEGGKAVAELLCGLGNPSGKLSDTFAKRLEDYPSIEGFHYKEVKVGNDLKMASGYPEHLMTALEARVLTREEMEICVKRILKVMLKYIYFLVHQDLSNLCDKFHLHIGVLYEIDHECHANEEKLVELMKTGTGISEELKRVNPMYVGVDFAASMIEAAEANFKDSNIEAKFILADIMEYGPTERYDMVIS